MRQEEWRELERVGLADAPVPYRRQDIFELWFSLRGRIPRSDYWLRYCLPIAGLNLGAMFVDATLGTLLAGGVGVFSLLFSLASIWPGVAVSVKRLHDLGYPGWYVPAMYGAILGAGICGAVLIPIFGGLAALVFVPLLVLSFYAFWIGLKMAFFRGVYGPNAYGADPLA